jgi:hypothetical protein
MRKAIFMCNVLLLLGIASPALLCAQFQKPTDEELKMTADPKAPGAAAVYLNIEEITDDSLHYHSFYARIKVLAEKGKELATVEIPYEESNFKVENINARTIHSDGTIVPLTGKPEDLLISKSGDREYGRKVFTLPSVEVGSILEYHYQFQYPENHVSSPFWEIQRSYFVHKAHYAFTPFKAFLDGNQNFTSSYLVDEHGNVANNLLWWYVLPPGVEVKKIVSRGFTVDVKDVQPIPDEEWIPPIRSLIYKVYFYYKNARSSNTFWMDEAKLWSKDVDHFAEPSKPIHDAVSGLIARGDNDVVKAKKLYKAVQALDNTDFSRRKEKSELKQLHLKAAKRAEDTWSQKSGSSQDIALLYLAMLRAAGLNAYAMKVVDRDEGMFALGYLSLDQLDDYIIILTSGGEDTILDPGEKMCPFGMVHWKHTGAGGLLQTKDGQSAGNSPLQVYTDNTLDRTGGVRVDDHGAVTGNLRFVMAGQEALYWRQLALQNDQDEVKKRFDDWLKSMVPAGVDAHVDSFQALDDSDVSLVADIKVTGTLGSVTSRRLLLPAFFFATNSSHPFVKEDKRQEPVDMHYPEQVSDNVNYYLPPDMTVEGAPQDEDIPWEGHASFMTQCVTRSDLVTVTRQLARAFTFAKPEEYQELRGYYQKIDAVDQQQLVLTAPPATKGN